MKVLLVSSEVAPFAKTGGLADVANALPAALSRLGVDVRIAMPGYNSNKYTRPPAEALPYVNVQLGTTSHVASVSVSSLPTADVPVYFINSGEMYNRAGLYHDGETDFPDNAERFAFFCKSAIWAIKGLGWIPDVIHCNDWQTGLLPLMLRTDSAMAADPDLQNIRTMFTVHNMAYQGIFPPETAINLGLGNEMYYSSGIEFYGQLNLMKTGLVYADLLTTVSPTYAREIQTPEFGCALDGVLRQRAANMHGILNGIDYDEWNPAADPLLPAHYTADDLTGKAACKFSLQKELGLTESSDTPLLVLISRLDPQKGFDILLPIIDELMALDVQLAILGTGLPAYHSALATIANRYHNRMSVRLKFDNGLAHRMEAGGDIFLMPSRYEPCGLNQMYSMHYGTVPVVHRTGGLADSVTQFSEESPQGTGFLFDDYTSEALLRTIRQALQVYPHTETWNRLRRNGMETDFSWGASARKYQALYSSVL